MAENEVKNIQINGRTYAVADEKARKQIDEQNKNLNVRYNSETDKIQCLFNGEWVDIMSANIQNYLFKNTDFEAYAYRSSTDASSVNNFVAPTISNVSTYGDTFTLTGASKSSYNSSGCIFTKNKVSLTNKNKIIIVCTRNSTGGFYLKTTQDIQNAYTATKSAYLTSGINEIDISDLDGEHYVGISYVMQGSGGAAPTIDITKIELV